MQSVTVESLSKQYVRRKKAEGRFFRVRETIDAIDGISFRMDAGEIVGLVGPNGAGKSTLVKTMTGILTPTRGTCRILGYVPWEERRRYVRHIGTVFGQRPQLWWDLPVGDSLRLLRDIYALPEGDFRKRMEELTGELEMESFLDAPLRTLSLGQRMRAELAGALLHCPELLFLDEPTIGLDAVSKLKLRAFLKSENERRATTILLTTHDTSDLMTMCPRALVLGHGKLLYDGEMSQLLSRYDREKTLVCTFHSRPDLSALPCAIRVAENGEQDTFTWSAQALSVEEGVRRILALGPVREMRMQETDADELIARMYREMRV
ncbi:MAG: ATP-binding cassette domain-containing protein [Clostridia bacterium]|nr:ATP-binding cassette domain-containing protein [Clostridia bacterium]